MIQGFVKLYREKGLNVIPLKPKSKFPDETNMPINPQTGKRGWKIYQTEKCNIEIKEGQNGAVLCGESSGNLVVIDLDDRELSKVFDDWEKRKNETLIVETGKGYHVCVKPKGKLPEKSLRLINDKGQRIDIQSQGTYVLIPGSINPETGKEYKIISSTLDIQDIDLDGFINSLSNHGFNPERIKKGVVEILKGVKEGERDYSVYTLGVAMRHSFGLKEDELLYHLSHFNQTLVFPPLPEVVIKQKVQSVMNADVSKIRFKEFLEEFDLKEVKLKYDDTFWKDIEDLCEHNKIKLSSLNFKCENCGRKVILKPEVTDHKNHNITIIYK